MKLPRYESYKDSGVEWIGEIPEEWEIQKAKFVWRERNERSVTGDEQLLSVSQYYGVRPNLEQSRSESLVDYKITKKNDLVINIMLAWLGGLGTTKYEGLVSPSYAVYRSLIECNTTYLGYLYRTPNYLAEFARRSTGVVPSRWRMYTEYFGQVLTLLPPLETQERIASFLDQKTAGIDEAIAKKQKLIELLQEQKSILINQAVTKGLNPDAPMKDSGVEWIGEIPAHWLTPPMYARFRIELGKMLDSKRITGKRLLPYLRNTDVQWDGVNTSDLPEMDFAQNEIGRFTVKPGDLLVCEGGEIGRSAICDESFADATIGYQKALHRVRPSDESESIEYLYFTFVCAGDCSAFTRTAKANTISHLTGEILSSYRFPKPPIDEQIEIASYLNKVCKDHEAVIKKNEESIARLQEYKQNLISSAVTGKIKV